VLGQANNAASAAAPIAATTTARFISRARLAGYRMLPAATMPLQETPYWDEGQDLARPAGRPAEPPPARVDVAVVGGGYTGLSAALRLARSGARVVVLDKQAIGGGASSRNGGQVLTGLKLGVSTLLARYGVERARALFALSLEGIGFLESLLVDEKIECDYRRAGHLEAAFKPAHFEGFRREQETLARVFDHPVRLVTKADQRSELGSELYHGLLLDERSGALHPGRYVRGLAEAAARAGAQLFSGTPALAVTREAAAFRISTPAGPVVASDVVIATNGYTDGAVPALRRRIVPIGSFIVATRRLGPELGARLLPRRRVAFDSKNFLFYFRLSPDDRLIFGGRAQFTPSTPSSTRRSAEILRQGMLRVFPELADVELEYAWSGNIGVTTDLLPRAGRLDGMHYALGYAGHGVALATYLGARVADLVLGCGRPTPLDDLPFRAIPLYEGRPWFLPAVGAWYKLLDWIQ
jgi:glycine/D-amino acid oxidase-like deaminating enzyme